MSYNFKSALSFSMVALINPVGFDSSGASPAYIQDATTISILTLLPSKPLSIEATVQVSTSLSPSQLIVDGLFIYVVMVDKTNDRSEIVRYTTNYSLSANYFPFKTGTIDPNVQIVIDKTFGTNGIVTTTATVTDLKIVTSHWGKLKTGEATNLCKDAKDWEVFNVGMTGLVTSQVSSDGKVSIVVYRPNGTLLSSTDLSTPPETAPRELINIGIVDRNSLTASRITTFGDIMITYY